MFFEEALCWTLIITGLLFSCHVHWWSTFWNSIHNSHIFIQEVRLEAPGVGSVRQKATKKHNRTGLCKYTSLFHHMKNSIGLLWYVWQFFVFKQTKVILNMKQFPHTLLYKVIYLVIDSGFIFTLIQAYMFVYIMFLHKSPVYEEKTIWSIGTTQW